MLELTLESGVADAPPLSPAAASLLASQIESVADAPLPANARLHEALYGVPVEASSHAEDDKPAAEHRLPARIITGLATDVERTTWRACYEAGLHELLSAELLDAIAVHITAALLTHPNAAATAEQAAGGASAGLGDAAGDAGLPLVLEIGAGNGALSYHLAARLKGIARVVVSAPVYMRISVVPCHASWRSRHLSRQAPLGPGIFCKVSEWTDCLPRILSISLFCIFCQNHATLLHQFLAFSLSRFLAFYLSYFTRARDNHLQCYIRSQATDDGSSKIKPVMEVLPLAYTDALSTLQPAVVVCAWMPSGVDFSKAIRTCPTVLEMVRACTYRCKSCGRACECHCL